MHAGIAVLARKHSLTASAVADLEALWSGRKPGAASTLFDGYASVDLEGDAPPGEAPVVADRYEDLGLIGQGGMGEVRRVRDLHLNRTLAMKIVHPQLLQRPAALARFLEEAQATAQLQHPSIVPVHDLGTLPDGRAWFTMKEVRGRTLADVIAEVHAASGERWEVGPSGWTFRRLITAFHAVCQAVAYAHERGVVHRDLKPDNTMVGTLGEVYVLDWGLAKIKERPDIVADASDPDVVQSVRSADHATRVGQVTGTPAYMPPEQARGQIERIDARSDVYALGAMLYEILSGRAPYEGPVREVLQQVVGGPPPALGQTGPPLPEDLVRACERAMAHEPGDRFPSAIALAGEVAAWLDGSKRRERALEVVQEADATVPEAEALRARAAALRDEAEAELAAVPAWAPEDQKLLAWAKQDEAAALASRAVLKSLERDQLLAGALTHAPDLPEAHAAMAEDQRARHAAAERAHDADEAARAEVLLRSHAAALPDTHPVRQRCAIYLRGTGAVTLVTEPEGAEVELLCYEPYGRRLVARPVRSLGRTPLLEVPLEMGSYLLLLRHPERATVRYPVHIARGAHWDGIRPGDRAPFPIELPHRTALGPDDCYVPAGWFRCGGLREHAALPPGSLWCDPFVVRRFPVTNRDYLDFLDDLVARGREEEALRHAPRERGGPDGELGTLICGRDEAGRFVLRPDTDGDVWLPDAPVLMVDWACATAYARWYAARTLAPWRLPWDLEWEKAARGVDGRLMPWGDGFDPAFCNMRDSHSGRPVPSAVDTYPLDESVYGVRGLGGNVRDLCVDVWTKEGPPRRDRCVAPYEGRGEDERATRVVRGGYWGGGPAVLRSAVRAGNDLGYRDAFVGFRLARPAP